MRGSVQDWLRFNTVGLLGVGVQLLVLACLESRVRLGSLPATILAVEAAVVHNFIWHERWTWKGRHLDPRGVLGRLVRFHAGNGLISLAGNIVLMWLLASELHIHYLISNAAAIGVCASVNFIVSDRLIFAEADTEGLTRG